MTCGVYLIRCSISGLRYIGSSKNIEARWIRHKVDLRKGKNHNTRFQAEWNNCGGDSFSLSILEECESVDRIFVERKWYEALKPELNSIEPIGPGGGYVFTENALAARGSGFKGKRHSNETKRKLSERFTGRKMSQEFCKKLGDRLRGVKQSPETIAKRVESRKKNGKRHSEEAKRKMSESHKKLTMTNEHKANIKEAMRKYRLEHPAKVKPVKPRVRKPYRKFNKVTGVFKERVPK